MLSAFRSDVPQCTDMFMGIVHYHRIKASAYILILRINDKNSFY